MMFTVIIPTKNRGQLVLEAIASIKAQTFSQWELIIVDDGSTDNTKERLAPHLGEQIRYIRNEQSVGPAAARNMAIRAANPASKYISLLDDDDTYHPDFLKRTYEVLSTTGNDIGFCWTGLEFHYTDTGRKENFFWDPPFKTKDEAYLGFLERRLIGTGFGITFKKLIFEKVGYFDESMRAVEDTDYFLRILQSFFYAKIPDILYLKNILELRVDRDSYDKARGLEIVYDKHVQVLLTQPVAWYYFKAKIASIYYRLRDKKKARALMRYSLTKERFSIRLLLLWGKLELTHR